jgi:sugar/nucleoside kinase (ribokinase family)
VTGIVVVGDITTEIITATGVPSGARDLPASILITGGGSGYNTAGWLAAAGVDVTLCGVAGDDDTGDIRLAELEVRGVTCAVRREPAAATGAAIVLAEATLIDRGANAHLGTDDIDAVLASARQAVHLHLCGSALVDEASRPAALHALSAAAERGLTTSVDAVAAMGPDVLDWVRATDALFATVDQARALLATTESDPTELARALARWCGIAVVQLAEGGAVSYMIGSTEVTAVPGIGPGASDAFVAGYLAAWLAGASGRDALAVGAEMAALD